ncbi:MAG: hypothetical protein Q7T25_12330, partial [Sideroxyarcus sp.]|nr:hypothetical protein [Sideroxyarcus sp.]
INADNVGSMIDGASNDNKPLLGSNPQMAVAINDALDQKDQEIRDDATPSGMDVQYKIDEKGAAVSPNQLIGRNAARRLDAGMGAESVGYLTTDKKFDGPDSQAALIAALQERPELVVNLGDALKAENFGGQIGQAVTAAMKNVNVSSLGQKVLNAGSQAEQSNLVNAINQLERAVRMNAVPADQLGKQLAQFSQLRKRKII